MNKISGKDKFTIKSGNPLPLGLSLCEEGINCAIAVEKDNDFFINFYKIGEENPDIQIRLGKDIKDEFRIGSLYVFKIAGISYDGYEYTFESEGQQVIDPYAKWITGSDSINTEKSYRCRFYDKTYDWQNDMPLQIPFHESIMYSLHIRGFTKHNSSKVKHKGTFLGVIEKIPYLKELGINQIKVMPCYEFDEQIKTNDKLPINPAIKKFMTEEEAPETIAKSNYWGYGDGYYFAPKASYSATNDPIREFKDMIKALHENQIEIIMEFFFGRRTNYHLVNECVRYWVLEYHIDGVQIIGDNFITNMLATDPLLSRTKILNTAFDVNAIYNNDTIPAFKNLAEYSDSFKVDIRKFLKSDEDQLTLFLNHSKRNPRQAAVINYITEHNGFTLTDLVSYDKKHNEANGENNEDGADYNFSWNCGIEGKTKKRQIQLLRKKQIKNAFCFLFLSQGTPMLLSGDEMGKSQQGNNNAYCQDNDISYLNWNQMSTNAEIMQFVTNIIAFRKAHPILHSPEELRVMDYLGYGYPDVSYHSEMAWYPKLENYNRHIGVMYCGRYAKKGKSYDDFIYIAYNMHWEEHSFALPKLPKQSKWYKIMDTNEKISFIDDTEAVPLDEQKDVVVTGRSIVIIIGK